MNADTIIQKLKKEITDFKADSKMEKVGTVLEVGDGVVKIAGLFDAVASEMVVFQTQDGTQLYGLALNLEEDQVGAIVFGEYQKIKEGDVVKSTGTVLSVPVGGAFTG